MRFAGLVLAVCLVLAGCGGGDEPKAKATPKPATKTTKATAKPAKMTKAAPTVATPTGAPAPGDLRDFQCYATKGVWNASGILKNPGKKPATYQVTAFVGQANGKDAKALTKEFQNINAGGSFRVVLTKIPAAKDATQCYVQVLRR